MFCGFTGKENWPVKLPPPLLVSVPIKAPLDVTNACSVAVELVLVASTFKTWSPTAYSATVMATVSAAGGGGGVTVSGAVTLAPPKDAEMVAELVAVTDTVVTVKVALVAPAAIVTLAGTLATTALLLESDTSAPPLGAAEVSVTVPVEVLPPTRLKGLNVSDDKVGVGGGGGASGFTVKVADWVTPPPETEIVTTVCTVTAPVKMLKPPVVTPAGIVTLLLTKATAGLLLVS